MKYNSTTYRKLLESYYLDTQIDICLFEVVGGIKVSLSIRSQLTVVSQLAYVDVTSAICEAAPQGEAATSRVHGVVR